MHGAVGLTTFTLVPIAARQPIVSAQNEHVPACPAR
jgi:hypothetical protein